MPSDPLTELSETDRARLEAVLVEFDLGWAPGRIAAAAARLPPAGPFRAAALREMVKIDLERLGRAGRAIDLQDYLHRFPELRDGGAIPDDLLKASAAARNTAPPAADTDSGGLPNPFGRYQIARPLGQGGMGSVYLARDTELDRLVALKVPHFGPDDAAAVDRFTREARAAATIDHPNVCRVYDVGRIDGVPYISMAYVEGPTLADALRDGPLPPRRAAEIARDVARALAEAHRRGVVHRDLKPANILLQRSEVRGQKSEGDTATDLCPLSSDLCPVVTDFGLAWRGAPTDPRQTAEGTVAGTPPYMSPEQVTGERAGPAGDVYSLGAVLYEMLTGRPPFTGTRTDIFTQVLTTDPTPPSAVRPEVDPRLDAVARKSLAKRPQDRFADMSAFADALDRWLAAPADGRRAAGWWTGLAAAAALVILGVGVVVLVRRGGGDGGQSPPTPPERVQTTVWTTGTVTPSAPAAGTSAPTVTAPRSATIRGLAPKLTVGIPRPPAPGELRFVVEGSAGEDDQRIVAVSFSPDDKQVYAATVGETDMLLRHWDVGTGKEAPAGLKPFRATWAAFAANGEYVLVGGWSEVTELKRSATGETTQTFVTKADVLAGALSRDGRRAIVGFASGPDPNPAGAVVYDVRTGLLVQSTGKYRGHKKGVRWVALSANGGRAFSASDDWFASWDVATRQPAWGDGAAASGFAAYLGDSGRVVVGFATGEVKVYSKTGTLDIRPLTGGPKKPLKCLAVSADGRLIVGAWDDGTFRVWEGTTSWPKTWTRMGPAEPVVAAAFSSNGTRLVTATARSWAAWDLLR
ncbi:MAG TPA: serine/threonine-protein kinase [Gemmataceae bacterium]|nr:serine/threonine-protein kinase [Gemmataceae bacterium]